MLQNYIQYHPAKILFGKGVEKEAVNEIKALQCKRVLIHHDAGDFIQPLVERIKTQLEESGLMVFTLGGVVPNPKLSLMKEGCRIVKEEDIDFVLAIGGGSTMDSAKYIACGTYYEGDLWNHPSFTKIESKVIKHGVIVTMPGTGSDVSSAAVWRDDTKDPEIKTCVFAQELRFDLVFINPELHYTLPPFQTAAGCFDVMAHCMEDYFCAPKGSEFYLSAYEGVINDIMRNVKVALQHPDDYSARANIARVAYVPLEDVIVSGAKRGYCVHNAEKPMTGTYHRTHGEMLAILFPAWWKYVYRKNMPLFTRLAVRCFGAKMDYENPERTILEGVANLEHFIKEIGLPTRLHEIGIDETKFEYCADLAVNNTMHGYIGEGIKLYKTDILEVYRLAK